MGEDGPPKRARGETGEAAAAAASMAAATAADGRCGDCGDCGGRLAAATMERDLGGDCGEGGAMGVEPPLETKGWAGASSVSGGGGGTHCAGVLFRRKTRHASVAWYSEVRPASRP